MDADFFAKFPVLVDDIQPRLSIPPTVCPRFEIQGMLLGNESEQNTDQIQSEEHITPIEIDMNHFLMGLPV